VAAGPELAGLPVIANVGFGHGTPMLTFPVGGTIEVRAGSGNPQLTVTRH
jgi:muramoyltetrapeptide carboxypeptidase LdcA involved in peptidoglycan recycling